MHECMHAFIQQTFTGMGRGRKLGRWLRMAEKRRQRSSYPKAVEGRRSEAEALEAPAELARTTLRCRDLILQSPGSN
jgi:hypothetical protein